MASILRYFNELRTWSVISGLDLDASYFQGAIGGLNLSNDSGAPNSILDVSAGYGVDSTNSTFIKLGAFTKTTGGVWVAGTGQFGMGTGLTIANTTWYHVFAITNAGIPDVYFDTSASAANAPTGTTVFRRIGSFRTDGSAHILPFIQNGDNFMWATFFADIAANNPGTAAVTRTLTVPTGVKVQAIGQAMIKDTTTVNSAVAWLLTDLALTDQAGASTDNTNGGATVSLDTATGSNDVATSYFAIWTNTSAQIRSRATASAGGQTFYITTQGWNDPRGRFA